MVLIFTPLAILSIGACLETPSTTLLQLAAVLNQGRELSSLKVHTWWVVKSHETWTLDHGHIKLTIWHEVVLAEMLLYTATTPYYIPVVIAPVLVQCLSLSTKVSKSALPVTLPFNG